MSDQDATLDEYVQQQEKSQEVRVGELQQLESSPIESWELVSLGEILSLEYGDNLPSDSREDGNIPVYGSNGQVDTHTEATVDRPGIVLGRKGSIGEIEFSNKPFWPIDTTYYITKKETSQNLRFLYYLLQNIQLERLNAASAIPGLNRNDTYRLNAIVPPLPEQRKIATVLYTVDQAIEKIGEIIEQTKTVEEGLMQDLFRKGIGEHKTKELRRIGQVPEYWDVVKLGDVCEKITDGTHKSPPTIEEGYPYITSQNVRNWGFDLSDLKYISGEDHNRITSRCNPGEGDVLYVKDGANTGNVNVNTLDFEFSLLSSVALIKPNRNRVKPWFLKYLLSWPKFRDLVLSQMSGTGIRRLTISKLEKTDVLLPPMEEQEQIIDVLNEYYTYRQNQKENKVHFQRLKRGLMQDLLSGKVRTHDKDIEVVNDVIKYG